MNGEKLMVKHVTVHITSSCNLNCEFCHVNAECGGIDTSKIDSKILENLFVPSVESISIAGGEPFYVKEKLYDFIEQIPQTVKSVAVTTNGLLITEEDILKLKQKNIRLQFSLDGTILYHEKNRGKNTYQKSLSNLKKAVDAGIRVDILTTVSNENMDYIVDYLKDIDDIGAQNITLLHFTPKGRGAFRPELEVPKEKWIQFCLTLKEKLENSKTRTWIQPRFLSKWQLEKFDQTRQVYLCNCYRFEYAYVDICNGMIYPCGLAYGTPLGIGNLKTENLQNLADKAVLQAEIPDECKSCKDVQLCKGGAKCYSWLHSADLQRKDADCTNGAFFPICPFPAQYVTGAKMHTDKPTII